MMDAAELRAFIREHFTRSAFRLETLQQYEVASDGNDFERYLAGDAAPTVERKQPWLDRLRGERNRGLYRHRVRIVTRPVSDYTRYECEWGYLSNSEAGEDIRILDLGERAMPQAGWLAAADWWLIDETHLLAMVYAADGSFAGARPEPPHVKEAVTVKNVLWAAAESFHTWWSRHTELHRDRGQAT
jgi:hypothetical protein